MTTSLALSVTSAAAAAAASERSIRNAIANGDLPAHYLGRKPLILVEDLEAWLKSLPTQHRLT